MEPLPTPADWEIGQIINNHYEVRGLLGEGGMGRVYLVHPFNAEREWAVKRPRAALFTREGGQDLFMREAEQWVKLGVHPHIVQCYYVHTLEGIPCIFAEYMAGGSLKDWIERQDRPLYRGGPALALGRILDVAIQMAWGLDYAHQQGLIHQDVKPANVLLTSEPVLMKQGQSANALRSQEGTAKIADFGLAQARVLAGEAPGTRPTGESLVVPGVGMLTPAYASPEQTAGQSLTRHTDLWSWAVSVLELFMGGVTWHSGVIAAEVLEGYLATGPDDPALPQMPPGVVTLLRQCFQPDPVVRPANLQVVATALQACYAQVLGQPYPRAAPQADAASAESWTAQAISMQQLGKVEEALAAAEQALRLDPRSTLAWMAKGQVLHKLKRDEEALAAFEQMTHQDPNLTDAWYFKGHGLHNLGLFEEALVAYDQALRLDPQDAIVWRAKGYALYDLERLEEALAAFEQALRLDPQDVPARELRDSIREKLRPPEQALEEPQDAVTLSIRAVTLAELGRKKEALAAIGRAQRMDAQNAGVWNNFGYVLKLLGSSRLALAAYDKALLLDSQNAGVWNNKGHALHDLEQLEEALAAFEQALRLDPNLAAAWNGKGTVLTRRGRYEEALAAFEQMLLLDPNDALAWRNKSVVLSKLKRFEEALSALDQVLRLDPRNFPALDAKCEMLHSLGRYEEALAGVEQWLRLDPTNMAAASNKAILLRKLGRVAEAMQIEVQLQRWQRV